MSLGIGKAIYNILSTNTNVKAKVGTKIYPLVADNGTTFPFIVYRRNSITPATSKDRYVFSEQAIVEVVVADDEYDKSIELAELVITALQGKKGVFNNINIVNIDVYDSSEDFTEDTFIQNITFKININN